MDHIIRDAVDKHHPAYNDKAWEKMEKKLDQHLPQQRGRRRFLFFLLLFLLLGGAAFFGINYFSSNKTPLRKEIAENKKSEQTGNQTGKEEQTVAQPITQHVTPAGHVVEKPATGNETAATVEDNKTPVPGNVPVQTMANAVNKTNDVSLPEKSNSNAGYSGKNKRPAIGNKGRSKIRIRAADPSDELTAAGKQKTKGKTPEKKNIADKKNVVITAAEPENTESENSMAVTPEQKKEPITLDAKKEEPVKTAEDKKEEKIKEKEVIAAENKKPSSPDKNKPKKNFAGNFGITLSAGPDLSFVELNKLGKATLIYGAGISYRFMKRITVRAGFYSSKKIYSAKPDQYTFQGSSYPYLYDIDAVCKVYEIPVSLSYNFGQRKNHNWFGNAGLSSFLMKTEDYDYVYKVPNGQSYTYYTYKAAIKDRNKHYFAVLTLSAGYQYNFSKRISLQAEPYVKLPLGGVGEGKIKLKSAGVLFTATVRPFAKKK